MLACESDAATTSDATLDTVQADIDTAKASTLHFSMNKWLDPEGKSKAAVTGSFRGLQVQIDSEQRARLLDDDLTQLSAVLTVDLTSIDTELEVRDTNIRETYLEVAQHPSAVATVSNVRTTQHSGEYLAALTLTAHGTTVALPDVLLRLQRVDGGWRVRTVQPIALTSVDFHFNVAALLARCLHKGIDAFVEIEADIYVAE